MKRYLVILGVLAVLTALALPAQAKNVNVNSNIGGLPPIGETGR